MIAAIDLGGTNTKYGILSHGRLIASGKCDAEAGGSIEPHLDKIYNNLIKLCTENSIRPKELEGIGILSTGIVDNKNMRVLSTNGKYDDAVDFNFVKWAKDTAGLPLRMDNDARGAAIGEWKYGSAAGCDNAVMMTIGTGIGTSVILNGSPLTGDNFTAGLLGGHIIVNSGGCKCRCGAVGCLEAEASGWALEEIVEQDSAYAGLKDEAGGKMNYKVLFDLAAAGNKEAAALQKRFLQLWAEAAVSYIHLFDPQKIVIGGGIMNEPELVLEYFRREIDSLAWIKPGQVEVAAASDANNAGLRGAAALFEN